MSWPIEARKYENTVNEEEDNLIGTKIAHMEPRSIVGYNSSVRVYSYNTPKDQSIPSLA